MELIDRNFCVISGNKNLEKLPSTPAFPYFMGCVEQKEEEDIFVEMNWGIDKETGLIQLTKLIPLDILYKNSHGSGSIGKIWESHHIAFASFIGTFSPNFVLEVGGAHGILAMEYEKINKIPWTIIEPNPHPIINCNATFIKGFFDENFVMDNCVDTLVHSHVFEHIYYPNDFISHISKFLKEGQNLIFSIPNLEVMLKKKFTNCLNFEHTVFLTEPYIDYLLAKHNFEIIKKEYFLEDHSIFYMCKKNTTIIECNLPKNLYDYNKNIYINYISYYYDLINELNKKIDIYSKKHSIFLFGAHIFSQFLIVCGLKTDNIKFILDNDEDKQNKRLYGSDMHVKSPKILKKFDKPIVILKAGVYNNEIKNQVLSKINNDVIFWE